MEHPNPKSERRFEQQRDYYKTKLVKSPIYEYATGSHLAYLDEILMDIQLVHIQYEKGPTRCHSKRSNLKNIQLSNVFNGSGSLSIILEGKPGHGKSTILENYAVDWARSKDEDGSMRHNGNSALYEKDLVIFIDKHHEGETLDETIKNAIRGTKAEKEDGLNFFKEYPEKTFLFADGLDEFLQKEVRDEIFKLLKDYRVNILVSCRQGHPYLEDKMDCFNRHIRVAGFRPEDSMAFVQSFMKALNSEEDDPTVLHQKCEALCSFLSKREAHRMYTSPINCAFLCILYSSGEITKDQLANLTSKDLYEQQQRLLLKREFSKTTDEGERAKVERCAQATIRGIHCMALHSLLHQDMQSRYSAEEAQKFGIDLDSPAMVLLQEEYEETADGPRKMFCWPHQTIKEFHVSNAAKDPAIMFFIASKPELNVVTHFLIFSLHESEPELIKELMTAVFLLQSKTPPCVKATWKKFKSRILKQKHACCEISELKKFLAKQDIDKLLQQELNDTKAPTIQRLTDIQKCLQGGDWVCRNADPLVALQDMIHDYQSESSLADIIHPFLPSASYVGALAVSDDTHGEDSFSKRVAARLCSTGYMILPSARGVVFEVIYCNPGPVAKLLDLADGVQKGVDEGMVLIKRNGIVDAITDISHPFVRNLLKKCASPDILEIVTMDDPTDKESDVWKSAIVEFNKVFKPKKGIKTIPDCQWILTGEDIQELTGLGIRLLDGHRCLVTLS